MLKPIKINSRLIGDHQSVFIIAELSANHQQNINLAIKTIKAAKKSGADAIKFQTYTADTITFNSTNKYFQIKHGTIWDGTTLYKLYKQAYTPWEWQPKLKKVAGDLGLVCFSSPFDETAVDFLEKMRVPAYKIGSPEIVDIPLLAYIARKKKPMVIATGTASLSDIDLAIKTCQKNGNNKIILLKCVSGYPAPLDELNIRTISFLRKKFKKLIGLSDHSLSINVTVAAVSLGAVVLEKHFILDRQLGGPDAQFSLEPQEFSNMVKAVRETEKILGDYRYKITAEMRRARQFAPSIFVVQDIQKNERFSRENIKTIRPGDGLPPKYYDQIIGKKARRDIKRATPLSLGMIVK